MQEMLGQSREEVKVACHEGSARVNSTADLGTVFHVQIWTKLQRNVGQVALDCDWHHPLEGASRGMVIMNMTLFPPPRARAGGADVDDVLGPVMDETLLVPPPALY